MLPLVRRTLPVRCVFHASAWLVLALTTIGCGPQAGKPTPATGPAAKPQLDAKAVTGLDALGPPIVKPVNPPGSGDLPPLIQLTVLEAEGHIGRNDYPRAVEMLEQVLAKAPDHPRIRKSLGLAYLGISNRVKALENLTRAAKAAPDDLMLQLFIGQLYASAEQYDQAILALRTALVCSGATSEEPLSAEALLSLGEQLAQQDYTTAALECYTRLYDWIDRHGRKYSERPRLRMFVLRPEGLLARRGELLVQLGRYGQAATVLQQALSRDRTNTSTAKSLFGDYIAARDYPAAEKLLADLVAEPSQQGQLAGLAEQLCRSSAQAAMPGRIWRACRKAGFSGGQLAVAMSQAALKLGSAGEAAAIIDSAIQKNPGDIDVGCFLAELRLREGKIDQALEQLARLLDANPQAGADARDVVSEIAAGGLADDFERKFAQRVGVAESPIRPGYYCVLGQLAKARDHLALAEEYLTQSLTANEGFLPAYETLADFYFADKRLDDVDKLRKRTEQAARTAPQIAFFAPYLAGKVALECGRARAAVEALEKAGELNEEFSPTLLLLGEAYACLGQDAKSAEAYLEASALLPEDVDILREAFDRFVAIRQWESARQVVAHALEADPNNVTGQCMMTELLAQTGQRAEAGKLLHRLVQQSGDDEGVQLLAIRAELDSVKGMIFRRRFDRASQKLREIAAKNPANTKPLLVLVELLGHVGLDDQAAETLQQLHRDRPAHGGIALAYAATLLRANRNDQAVPVLQAVLAENPEDLPARRWLLEALEKLKRFDRAALLARQWMSETKDANGRNWYRLRLLNFCELAEDFSQAQALLDDWLTQDMDSALRTTLRTTKAQLYGKAGQHDRAAEYCRQWVQQSPPDDPLPRFRLLAALAEGKAYEAAQEQLAQWSSGDTDNPPAFREAGIDLFGQAGQIDKAVAAANDWLRESPWALPPRRALVAVLSQAKQYDKALNLIDGWLTDLPSIIESMATTQSASNPASKPARVPTTQPASSTQPSTTAAQTSQSIPQSDPSVSPTATSRSATSWASRPTSAIKPTEAMRKLEARASISWCRQTALNLLLTQRQYDLALQRARQYATWEPNDPEFLNVQSTCLAELDRPRDSIALLEAGLAANPQESGLKNNLSYNYAEAGVNLAQAEQLIRQALSTRGDEPAYQDTLGWVLYKQGRLAESAAIFEGILQSGRRDGPGYALMYDHAGDVLYRLGWTDQAAARWTKAVELAKSEKIPNAETRQILGATPGKIEAFHGGTTPAVAPLGQGVQPGDE